MKRSKTPRSTRSKTDPSQPSRSRRSPAPSAEPPLEPPKDGPEQVMAAFGALDVLIQSAFKASEPAPTGDELGIAQAAMTASARTFSLPLVVLTREQALHIVDEVLPQSLDLESHAYVLRSLKVYYDFVESSLAPDMAIAGQEAIEATFARIIRERLDSVAQGASRSKSTKKAASKKKATRKAKNPSTRRKASKRGSETTAQLPALDLDTLPILAVEWDEDMEPFEPTGGEFDESFRPWVHELLLRGARPVAELFRAYHEDDPILHALDLHRSGREDDAEAILWKLIKADPQELDAYAHLGHFAFENDDLDRAEALYRRGVAIADRAIGSGREVLTPWGLLGNRPFLRCLHGLGLCRWRRKDWDGAFDVFDRLLWLNPLDNQGVRFLLPSLRSKQPWSAHSD